MRRITISLLVGILHRVWEMLRTVEVYAGINPWRIEEVFANMALYFEESLGMPKTDRLPESYPEHTSLVYWRE